MHAYTSVSTAFSQHFSGQPKLYASPGRINVLGEHTDYNDGFVLPAAIDKEVIFAIALNQTDEYRFVSLDMNETYSATNVSKASNTWANYLLGVIAQLQQAGFKVPGFDLVFGGDIPIGAGVSSSAAIECGLAYALNDLLALNLTRAQLAKFAQMAEHEYAGVKCGIMDQFAVLHGEADRVIKLDCRSLEYSLHKLDLTGYKIVLCDTLVKHSLASSAYNKRREKCDEAVAVLAKHYPVASLRDANLEQLQQVKSELSPEAFTRATYVIEENARVAKACDALADSNLKVLGELMYQTHDGLQHLYEVSCPELDQLVDIARSCEGVLGARMMGGGFGGCTINIVADEALEAFCSQVTKAYYEPKGLTPHIITTQLNNGTHVLAV